MLIELLQSQILKCDLSHISGEQIVEGNPEHCINLLQLVHEISVMMKPEDEEGEAQESPAKSSSQKQPSSQKRGRSYSDGGGRQDQLFGEEDFGSPVEDQHENMEIIDGNEQLDIDADDQAIYEQVMQAKQGPDQFGEHEIDDEEEEEIRRALMA